MQTSFIPAYYAANAERLARFAAIHVENTLKATAAIIGIIAAGLIFWYIVIAFMWMCYYAGFRM